MGDGRRATPEIEYQALREEMLQSRRYVFERPLLIVALGIAGFGAYEGTYVAVLPMLLTGLLLFNFWFTANRLFSTARIVAYIQLELEEAKFGDWKGWETCLRQYRVWTKENRESKREMIESELDLAAVPDALMYYPPIWQIHIALVALSALTTLVLSFRNPHSIDIICMLVTLALAGIFARYCFLWRPSVMRFLIERNRVIWYHVLRQMEGASHASNSAEV